MELEKWHAGSWRKTRKGSTTRQTIGPKGGHRIRSRLKMKGSLRVSINGLYHKDKYS